MTNKAIINYYARLLQKGYGKENIPMEDLPAVEARLAELEPREPDPETETPEKK